MAKHPLIIGRRIFMIGSALIIFYSAIMLLKTGRRLFNPYYDPPSRNHDPLLDHSDSEHSGETLDCSLNSAKYFPGFPRWPNYTTALSSYPRSGNTWLRTMIEKSTGYLTSSLYCDHKLKETLRAECNKTNRFLMKTHYPVSGIRHFPDPQSHWRRFRRFIHLIRNPFDAILSYHNFRITAVRTDFIASVVRQRRNITVQWLAGTINETEMDRQLRAVSRRYQWLHKAGHIGRGELDKQLEAIQQAHRCLQLMESNNNNNNNDDDNDGSAGSIKLELRERLISIDRLHEDLIRIGQNQDHHDCRRGSSGCRRDEVEFEGKRHTYKMDRTEFNRTMGNIYWYIAKYRAHYTYWKSVPIERLMVRYEDLRMDTMNELRRINRFLLHEPGLTTVIAPQQAMDAVNNSGYGEESMQPDMQEARLQCAIKDIRLAYYSSTRNKPLLHSLEMLGLTFTQRIIKELGPIICEMGYGDLLNSQMAVLDGQRISINCTRYETVVNINDIIIDRDPNYQFLFALSLLTSI